MRVHKDTPFELSMMPWEVEPPRPALMLVVKATFGWGEDGAPCTVAEEQVPCLGEVPWEDGDPPSLKTETDYAVLKPRAEWYLVGTAHAPAGRPTTLVPVVARVGKLQKQLVVWGDRVWRRGVLGMKPSEPAPFTTMPLRWERSFGGPRSSSNPVGRGSSPIQTDQGTVDALPNIEDPRRPLLSRDDSPPPAGMFPIPSTWKARITKTGTYDEIWKSSRWPFFPRDFDFSFFNCAPVDQQREGYWRGDEDIELHGLHPERVRIRTRLPGLRARVFVEWSTPRPADATPLELLSRAELEALGAPRLQDVPLRLDTIVIDGDSGHVLCTWRGLVDVADNRLTNVARIFVVHEPIETEQPLAHYESWLLRTLCEEADDLWGEDEPPAGDALAESGVALAESGEASLDVAAPELTGAVFQRELVGFLEALQPLDPETAPPGTEHVREQYRELGLDPDPLLQEPEVPVTPEIAEPPSLLRLEAIIRRRNRKAFAGLDLSDAPYRSLDLSGADFTDAILTGACLAGANLAGCCFDEATLARADLTGADARKATFRDADLSETRAVEARFEQAVLDGASGSGAVFTGARFRGASLVRTELEGCDLTRADLRDCTLDGADFVGSIADDADFMSSSLVDTSLESVRAHRAKFERCRMPDLRASDGADFTSAQLVLVDAPRAQLQGAILVGANLSGSNLEGADLSEAHAERINLVRCVLRGACFDRTDLREALMLSADCFEASFQEADLTKADARGAMLFSADLWRARTSGTRLDAALLDRTLLGSS